MKRIQFFEIEDQPWFPGLLRNYVTDYLQHVTNLLELYHPALDVLKQYIIRGEGKVIDLASGGGGPWLGLIPKLHKDAFEPEILLTDYFPNKRAAKMLTDEFPGTVEYLNTPVDARRVPSELTGLRTQFLSLHHFEPADVQKIFSNAVSTNSPILIMEAQERNFTNLVKIAFSPIPALFVIPFIRPFSWGRLLFTYLIPIIPFVIGFDGIVSVLRTYKTAELHEIAKKADPQNQFHWEGKTVRERGKVVSWFGGFPK